MAEQIPTCFGPTSFGMRFLRALLLFFIAMLGVGVAIKSATIPDTMIEQTGMSRETLLWISLANNALIIGVAVLVGALTAHRAGLVSLIAHRTIGFRAALARMPLYGVIGLLFGIAIAYIDGWLWQNIPSLSAIATSQDLSVSQPSLAFRLLYGAITEEVLLRWAMMSLIVWILFKMTRNRGASIGTGIAIAAILFGVGHLPAVYAVFDPVPTAMLIRVIGLNAALGIVYGSIYARANLESAMVAHASTHIGMLSAAALGLVATSVAT